MIIKVSTDLTNESSIIITNADKNLGIVVMDSLQYANEALSQLNDKNSYKQPSKICITTRK